MGKLLSRPYFDFNPGTRQYRQDMAAAARFQKELKKYSHWTWEHSMRVGADVQKFCLRMGMTEHSAHAMGEAAKLHDIGKIMISHDILDKPKKLSDNEMLEMKSHAAAGAALMDGLNSPFFRLAREVANYHHERMDGKGYYGLKNEEIPLSARIVTLCDVYDALCSPRHYRGKQASRSPEEVLLGMARPGGKYNFSFDQNLLRKFVAYKMDDPKVNLSTRARAMLKDIVHGGYTSHKDRHTPRHSQPRVAYRPAA